MTKKRNNAMIFISGILAGPAATYFLHTPTGKKLTKDVKDQSIKLAEEIADKSSEITSNIKNTTREVLTTAGEKVASIQSGLAEKTSDLLQSSNDIAASFKKGTKKAKRVLNDTKA